MDTNTKTSPATPRRPHPAADALDWDEAIRLIRALADDGRYRDAMLIASGCFLGLRISDILRLRWKDLCEGDTLAVTEKKTGKTRLMRINPRLRKFAGYCMRMSTDGDGEAYIFSTQMYSGRFPMTRQRAAQILQECKRTYGVKSAAVFSTHSLRKTFGRRVWLRECEKNKGEQALVLLQDVFGHSSVAITKRYLGIRRDEILSVYDSL